MEKTPKVSVIIPVYNTEEYVREALRSITGQSLAELEIIVVNDGSTDGSLGAIEETAAGDPRIKIISQPNKGLAGARNTGMRHMHGRYVYFMDSDDILESDALKQCYEKCESENLDVAFFDAELFGAVENAGRWADYNRQGIFSTDKTYDGAYVLENLIDKGRYRTPVWLNFIRRTLLDDTGLDFMEGIQHEDELFTPLMFMASRRTGRIDNAFFRRRIRKGSIMQSGFSQWDMDSYLTIIKELERYAGTRQDERTSRIVSKLARRTVRGAVSRGWTLPAGERIKLLWYAASHYPGAAGIPASAALLLKKPIKKITGKCRR